MSTLPLVLTAAVIALFLFAALLIVRGGAAKDSDNDSLLSRYRELERSDRYPPQPLPVNEPTMKAVCEALSEEML